MNQKAQKCEVETSKNMFEKTFLIMEKISV